MNSLLCNGSNVSYQRLGKNSGPCILFLHNGGTDHSIWSEVIEHLSTHYHIVCLDWPGFGLSESNPSDYSLDAYTKVLADFIGQLQLDGITLVGHCLGSAVALNYCHMVKGRGISHLILYNVLTPNTLSTSAGLLAKARRFSLLNPLFNGIENTIAASETVRNLSINYQIDNRFNLPAKSIDHLCRLFGRPQNLRSLISLMDAFPSYRHLDCLEKPEEFPPTLVVWSEKNKVLPHKHGKAFIKHFRPDESLTINAGHLAMLEKGRACAEHISHFINDRFCSPAEHNHLADTADCECCSQASLAVEY